MDIEVQASVFIKRVHGILKISVDSVGFMVKAQASSSCKQAFEISAFFKADWMIEGVTCALDLCQPAPRFSRGLVNGFEKRVSIHAAGAGGLHQRASLPQDAQSQAGQFAISR